MRTVFAVLFLASPLVADVGPKPREFTQGLQPARGDMAGVEIEMTSEEVALVLRGEPGKRVEVLVVDAAFEMTNLGGETEIEEGFPIGPVDNMENFRLKVAGEETATTVENLGEEAGKKDSRLNDWWRVWKTKYPAKAAVRHEVHYELRMEHRFYTGVTTSYILHTGAGWKNAIGKARVTFRTEGLTMDYVYHAWPERGLKRTGGGLEWTFENLEPAQEDDIRIRYSDTTTWKDRMAETRKESQARWGTRQLLLELLADVPFQNGRARNDEEHTEYVAAIASLIDEAVEKDGAWTMPAKEDDVNWRRYGGGGGGAEALFRHLRDACAAVEERPADPAAKKALAAFVALGDAFLADKLFAGENPIRFGEWEKGSGRRRFDADLARAKALLNSK